MAVKEDGCDTLPRVVDCSTQDNALPGAAGTAGLPLRIRLRRVREQTERIAIAQALQKTGWNRMAAARQLQISYRSILYKIVQYQIKPTRLSSAAGSGDCRSLTASDRESVRADTECDGVTVGE